LLSVNLVWRVMWSPFRSMSRSNVWNSMSATAQLSEVIRNLPVPVKTRPKGLFALPVFTRFRTRSEAPCREFTGFRLRKWMAGLDSTTQAAAPDPTSAIYLSCFPFSRACTSASGCCLLNCMIRGQQRPSAQLPRSPLTTTV
jgi:hypothetical protein